jgi:hypothetical protein
MPLPLATAREITEAKLKTLRPETQRKARAWLAACEAAGLLIYIYEGHRTCARQAELFKRGPDTTRAGPGQSMHQYKLAFDFVPLVPAKAAGMFQAAWGHKDEAKLYRAAHALAAKHDLRRLTWETPHLEDASFKNWQAARAAFGDPCRP